MTVVGKTSPYLSADRLPLWGMAAAVAGLLAELPWWPAPVSGVLLLAFVVIGPGAVLIDWWADRLPRVASLALVPVVSFCVVLLAVSLPLLLGFWSPKLVLLLLCLITAGGAGWNLAAARVRGARA